MYPESDYLLLSGLQHLRFCPRQCALIHIEQQWIENLFTAAGRSQHEKVHSGISESRKTVRVERNLKICSSLLGITGQTDAVEFYSNGKIIPVEYKHGEPKENTTDEIQLCAQAICLEEMLKCTIAEGALYYFKIRKRVPIILSEELRNETINLAGKYHDFVKMGITPAAEYTRKCESCSFIDICFPDTAGRNKSVANYVTRRLQLDLIPDDDL